MQGRRNLERYIFASKKPPGSSQMIQLSFDLMEFDTDLARKVMVNEIDKYIRSYQQWQEFDVKLMDAEGKATFFTNKEDYLTAFIPLDFTNILLIEYKRTGNFEIELDELSPEEIGFLQVYPHGIPPSRQLTAGQSFKKEVLNVFYKMRLLSPPKPKKPRTCWEILGIPEKSEEPIIQSAFRTKSLNAHPDKGGNAEQMRELLTARDAALKEVRKKVKLFIESAKKQ